MSLWDDQYATIVHVAEAQNHPSIVWTEVLEQAIHLLPRDEEM
jgi:hypothetical protein